MKSFLMYLFSFLIIAAGTATCVIVPKKIEFDKYNGANKIVDEQEDLSLMSMVESTLKTESFDGTVDFYSYDKTTNINAIIKINRIPELQANIDVAGIVNSKNVNCSFYYFNSKLYVDYENAKIYCATDDMISIVKNIISQVDGDIEDLFDVSIFADSIDTIEMVETTNGYQINANFPYINKVVINTDKNYFPNYIVAENIEISNKNYFLKMELKNSLTKQLQKPQFENYVNFAPSESLIVGLLKTYKQLPIKLTGNIEFDSINLPIEIKIDKSLNISFNFYFKNIFVKGFFVNENFYIEFSGTKIKMSIKEAQNLFSKYCDVSSLNSLTINEINNDSLVLNDSNTVVVDYRTDGSIKTMYAQLGKIALTLDTSKTSGVITSPLYADYISYSNFNAIVDKYTDLFSDKYSIDISGSYAGISIDGMLFINTQDFKSYENFYFNGLINSRTVTIAYDSTCYYLSVGSLKAKFSNACVTDLWKMLQQYVVMPQFSLKSIYDAINNNLKSVSVDNAGFANVQFIDNSSVSLKIYKNETIATINNLNINNFLLNATASIYADCDAYYSGIVNINKSLFKDYSATSQLASAISNTLKSSSYTLSGSLNCSIWGLTFKSLPMTLSFNNQSKQTMTLRIDNLPVTLFLTPYNAITYKKQTTTLVFDGEYVSITRQVYKRFSKTIITATSKTKAIEDLTKNDIANILGIKESLINNMPESKSVDVSKLVLLNSLNIGSTKMGIAINSSILANGISDCNTSLSYGNKLNSISAQVTYLQAINFVLYLRH